MTLSVVARSGHLAMAAGSTGSFQMFRRDAAKLRGLIQHALKDSYRPELHYMRGPGPKWRERHAIVQLGSSYLQEQHQIGRRGHR